MLIVIISICVFLILFIVSLLTWLCLRKKKGVYMGIIPKILYINLNHREDRKKNFLSNINGYDMGKDDKIVRIEGVHEKENGALGCLKSHIKALEYANKLDFPYVLVCEDDFQFFDFAECEKHVQTFMEKVKEWDVLLIGLNLNQKEDTEHEGVIRVLNSQTCSAFLIKKEYITVLLNLFLNKLEKYEVDKTWNVEMCTDVAWGELQRKDNWYGFSFQLGKQRSSFSDIEKRDVEYGV